MSQTPVAAEAVPPSAGLLGRYRRSESEFDELLVSSGEVRPSYAGLLGMLEQLGRPELKRRWDICRRLLHEQGILYNAYEAGRTHEKPWQLDPIPLVIAPEEWRALEAGLIQRAVLLNRILRDCYGPQELIHSRWLAPALVFAQPDFLRPCHGIRLKKDCFLHFYAADLARSPEGQWWVLSDRTQIPTGAGYALANRLVTSRILPESFRESHVQRLAGFFREVRNLLAQMGPRPTGEPRVVLLTPGPHNETYFEQAYLARYLGYMLVQGQDLTVRDDRVFLKTVSGLEPVDVILRRVDDDFCDPLELRNESILGVPGLVEAVRAGNVSVANALGSGLVQSPSFMPFLPGLCRHVLGEELKLPSVATWWCGQEAARKYVLEHLDELIVKAAFRSPALAARGDRPLSAEEREELRRRIEFDHDMFVAQETVKPSLAPVWEGEALAPKPIVVRVFLVAKGDSYCVMTGGLTRVSPAGSDRFIAIQRGGSSKDTWITSEKPVEEVSLLDSSGQSLELRRTGNNLPSRLADNFYWLGRYSERADASARLLRSVLQRLSPERSGSAMAVIEPLLSTLEAQGQLTRQIDEPDSRLDSGGLEPELLGAIFDPACPGSLRSSVNHLYRLALQVRDRTSNDMWRVISILNERVAVPKLPSWMLSGDAVAVLNETLLSLAAFHGLARENMTRAQAWRFLDIGLRIERAIYLATLLQSALSAPEPDNPSMLETVLEVADSSITYRSRYSLLPRVPAVFDLILLDDKNPRSVLFQLNQLAQHYEHLPRESDSMPCPGQDILQECIALLFGVDMRQPAAWSQDRRTTRLADAIGQILSNLPKFSEALAAGYFAHSTISPTGRSITYDV
jgi:uncharacterized circularly permuted ATP-grasp superfamily protein/uncharacterized alpha-E superfamily protein